MGNDGVQAMSDSISFVIFISYLHLLQILHLKWVTCNQLK